LIGQIKLTRIHVLLLSLPGVRVKQAAKHLFTMSKDPAAAPPEGRQQPNLLSVCDVIVGGLPSRSCGNIRPPSPLRAMARQPSLLRSEGWWSRTGSNRRPEACKATALPTELRPHLGKSYRLPLTGSPSRSSRQPAHLRPFGLRRGSLRSASRAKAGGPG
jgi:hypothetical protein